VYCRRALRSARTDQDGPVRAAGPGSQDSPRTFPGGDGSWGVVSDVDEELRIELDRVVTRLRVLGMRMSADGPRPPSAAGTADPVGRIHSVLREIADLAADAECVPRRSVPELAPNAVADQLLVLAQDLVSVAGPAERDHLRRLLVDLRQDLRGNGQSSRS
jgi:hypothetical protein